MAGPGVVPSWNVMMKDHLSGKTSILPETLMLRDEQFGWTAFHALFSYRGIDLQRRTSIFKVFQSMRGVRPIQLLKSQDRDGDTVFHSAINHRVDKEVIKMMISKFQRKTTETLLQVQNRKKLTPLQRAFQLREWELVEVLLSQCIKLNILPGLTGVRADISKTLLHRAFGLADHAAEYLRIHLRTCRECRISTFEAMQSLLVKDKKLLTPWHYLANEKDDDVIKAVVVVAVEHGIDINELYTDDTLSTLLHQAEKQCRPELAKFLESCGANPGLVNRYGLRPRDRRTVFDEENNEEAQEELDEGKLQHQKEETVPGSLPFHHSQQTPERGRKTDLVVGALGQSHDPEQPMSVQQAVLEDNPHHQDQELVVVRQRRQTARYDRGYPV